MKTIKKRLQLLSLIIIVVSLFLAGCKKSDDNNVTPVKTSNNAPGFAYGGTQYNGTWNSIKDVGTGGALGNIDVVITVSVGNNGYDFIIYNMPMQSSGSYSFSNGASNAGGSQLYALALLGTPPDDYASSGGTITKTGSNSFTFSCTMISITSSASITVTGQGSY